MSDVAFSGDKGTCGWGRDPFLLLPIVACKGKAMVMGYNELHLGLPLGKISVCPRDVTATGTGLR